MRTFPLPLPKRLAPRVTPAGLADPATPDDVAPRLTVNDCPAGPLNIPVTTQSTPTAALPLAAVMLAPLTVRLKLGLTLGLLRCCNSPSVPAAVELGPKIRSLSVQLI